MRDRARAFAPHRGLSVACVATCPPRQCGIATFSTDLAQAMRAVDPSLTLRFAAIESSDSHAYGPDVAWSVAQGHPESYRALADRINASHVDVVLLQHEFGLFGIWGPTFDDHLREFLEQVLAPVVTILHSVPPAPSPSVRAAVRRIARGSASVIVMAESAKALLVGSYGVASGRVLVIPHGVPARSAASRSSLRRALGVEGRPFLSTFGFLDPHKGLEHMIDAMVSVIEAFPTALYAIVGRTHPELRRREGEAYRHRLEDQIRRLGLAANVTLVDEYVSLGRIVEYLAASDVYVTPYLDMDQVTSGTLAYALGQGRAVVSTPYVHAAEALADGRGALVPPAEPGRLAEAVVDLLGRPDLRMVVERRAAAYGATMGWPIVAAQTLRALKNALPMTATLPQTADLAASPG